MTKMLKGIQHPTVLLLAYLLIQPDLSFETFQSKKIKSRRSSFGCSSESFTKRAFSYSESSSKPWWRSRQVFWRIWWFLLTLKWLVRSKETIRTKKINAEAGRKKSLTCLLRSLKEWKTILTCKNGSDIRDVTKRVLPTCLVKKLPNPASINEEAIVVAHDLTPSDTAQLNKKVCKAFVTNIGGRTVTQLSWLVHWNRSCFGTK